MDLFPHYFAVMTSAAVAFFGGSWVLKLLEKKRPEKPDRPPESTNQDR
jgi:hypothetical protein